MQMLTTIVFVAVMAAALTMDVRTNRIPNTLVLAGLGAGLALNAVAGWAALGAGLAGAGLALAVTFPLFALGAIGGGDAKLFMVVGAFLGPYGFFLALLASAVVGGVLGVAWSIRRGVILPVLLGCWDLLVHAVTLGRRGSRSTLDTPGAVTIPYGAAIALGSVATWFLRMQGL